MTPRHQDHPDHAEVCSDEPPRREDRCGRSHRAEAVSEPGLQDWTGIDDHHYDERHRRGKSVAQRAEAQLSDPLVVTRGQERGRDRHAWRIEDTVEVPDQVLGAQRSLVAPDQRRRTYG